MSAPAVRVEADEFSSATPFRSGLEHLRAELDWLRLALEREVLRLKAANLLSADPFRGLYLSDEQVEVTLQQWARQSPSRNAVTELDDAIDAAKQEIGRRLRASFDCGFVPPLVRLASLVGLSQFECDVLVASTAVEIDLRFETLYSWARNDVTRRRPSVDLAMRLASRDGDAELCGIAAFQEGSPLLRNRLLRIGDDAQEREASLLARSLRTDERIVRFLCDSGDIDSRLLPFTALVHPTRTYDSLYLPERLRTELWNAFALHDDRILYLCGPHGVGKRSAAEALCAAAGRPQLVCDLAHALACGTAPAIVLLLLQREATLQQSDLLLEHADALTGEGPAQEQFRCALNRLQPASGTRVFVAGESPWPSPAHERAVPWHCFDFPVPSFEHRARLWSDALRATDCPLSSGADIEVLAGRFALTGGAIFAACTSAAHELELRGAPDAVCTLQDLEAAARAQSNHGLCRFAQKVHGSGVWDALVLPPHIIRQLRQVCTAERYRHTVYTQWGFDRRLSVGRGLNVLFCGVSGTGKTMAASILAQELGRDLYRVDLSIVVSKYIGETEKQLSLIFREAQTSNAVLLFDEADALFGKRSEVKDAHDRYANIEVAYLLQRMDEYEGIVILATNLRRNMDDAFTRRMHHIVEFPSPDAAHRERIWKGIIPKDAPLAADLDFGLLARQFELTGGNIRNIALAAAFLAAEEGTAIRMEHCVVATAQEMQKSGKLPSRSEFRDYYELIRAQS